jgi:predicted transcriptional regulator
MLPSVQEIAQRRKLLNITQKELARLATVSQSFIAKMESGTISPSYDNVKRVLEVLSSMEKHESEEKIAKDLYHKRIVALSPKDDLYRAAKIMRKNKFHQLPVFDGEASVGSVTEKTIVDVISSGKKDFSRIRVSDVMEEPFPTVQENSPLTVVSVLLKHNPAVLITRKSKIVGIVTKADFIRSIK